MRCVVIGDKQLFGCICSDNYNMNSTRGKEKTPCSIHMHFCGLAFTAGVSFMWCSRRRKSLWWFANVIFQTSINLNHIEPIWKLSRKARSKKKKLLVTEKRNRGKEIPSLRNRTVKSINADTIFDLSDIRKYYTARRRDQRRRSRSTASNVLPTSCNKNFILICQIIGSDKQGSTSWGRHSPVGRSLHLSTPASNVEAAAMDKTSQTQGKQKRQTDKKNKWNLKRDWGVQREARMALGDMGRERRKRERGSHQLPHLCCRTFLCFWCCSTSTFFASSNAIALPLPIWVDSSLRG